MVLYLNETGTIGIVYSAVTTNITGNEFLTMLGIVLIIMLFFMIFRLPIEASAILVLPFLFILMSFNSNILAIMGVMLIFLALIFAKNWIF